MPHEVLPFSETEKANLTPFERTVIGQIALRGNQNVPETDRYEPFAFTIGDELSSARIYSRSGRLSYGSLWQIHRLEVDETELTYAHMPKHLHIPGKLEAFLDSMRGEDELPKKTVLPSETEVLITEFDDVGAYARTIYAVNDGVLEKSRVSRFQEGLEQGIEEFVTPQGPRLTDILLKTITNPEENIVAFRGLLRLTCDQKNKADKAHRDYDEAERKYQEHLDALNRINIHQPRRGTVVNGPVRYA